MKKRKTMCPDHRRYERGACNWPHCRCPDETMTADDLRLQIQILANTIATGEANEGRCYREMTKLIARLESLS